MAAGGRSQLPGQTGSNLLIVQPLNYVPQAYRTSNALRDTAAETFLTQTVNNPFQGLFPENPGGNGATIPRRRLLLQYPQFDTLNIEKYEGSNQYHGLLMRLDKRFTSGFMVMTTYTWSHFTEKVAPLNPWEGPEERIGAVDRPHRFTLATVTELPFGNGRKFGNDWNAVLNSIRRMAVRDEVRVPDGPAAHLQQQHLLRSVVRRSEGSEVDLGSTDSGQAGCRRAVLRHVVLLHVQRTAVP